MKKLSKKEYLALREGAEIIEADSHGDKVLLLADGTYLKLFRRKRLLSTALFFPYAKRFAQNAIRLAQLNIPTVSIIQLYRISSVHRTAVHYHPLTGTTFRNLPHEIDEGLAGRLGRFIRDLHDKGVYFRSLHLGNIVLTPENQIGLIDISDMNFFYRSLPLKLRLRNFRHSARYPNDCKILNKLLNDFNQGYQLDGESPITEQTLKTIYT
jgi:tRNA A-37 threonylcarbamoyl transferase component Bud32